MNENGTQGSFIITATQRPDNKTGSGSQRSGSGSGDDKATVKGDKNQSPQQPNSQNGSHNTPPEETKQYFEVHLDSAAGGFRGLPEDLER